VSNSIPRAFCGSLQFLLSNRANGVRREQARALGKYMQRSRWMSGIAASLLMLFAMQVGAQQVGAGELRDQRAALDAAKRDQVDVIAAKTYTQAVAALENAELAMDKGRKPEKIRELLNDSRTLLDKAKQITATTKRELVTVLKTRDDAQAAHADQFAPEPWRKGLERLTEAMERVERDDLDGAHKRGAEAEVLLRDAELQAIKNDLMTSTRQAIAAADAAKVEDFAPRTLGAAKRYLAEAEQEITRNRYDTALPKQLLEQANYEVKHATLLAQQISVLQDKPKKDHPLEELLLQNEEPLKRLAAELDVVPRFELGYAQVVQDLIERAQKRQQELHALKQDLADRDGQITALNTELKKLEDRLGGVSQERIALQKRVDAQERLRENITKLETAFTPNEARVYRQADDAVISLMGIAFRVGKSTIEPSSFPLLAKVQEAIKLFPGAAIVVEGHTDSDGSDSANLILSQDRADAVKQYLISNMGLDPEKVSSVGYGESRPVASNQTAEGRARNRRIDLVIHIDPNRVG
jgi:outer membrane protein OmpA-like peptidoglycan-associated protein